MTCNSTLWIRSALRAAGVALAAAALPLHAAVLESESEIRATGRVSVQLAGELVVFEPVALTRSGGVSRLHARTPDGRYLLLTDTGAGWRGTVSGRGGVHAIEPGAAKAKALPPLDAQEELHNDVDRDATLPKSHVVRPKIDPDPNETRLDILVVYTERAKNEIGMHNVRENVAAFDVRLNAAFANTGLPYTARIVAVEQWNQVDRYEEPLGVFLNNYRLNPGNAPALRERFGADLVMFFKADSDRTNDPATGRAGIYDGNRPLEEERELTYPAVTMMVHAEGAGLGTMDITATHEIGHQLGGGHQHPERGTYAYSSAHNCRIEALVRPEDAPSLPLNAVASAVSNSGTIIPVFSTPDLIGDDGLPCGDAAKGDNARTIRENFKFVSAFTPRMATPSMLTLPGGPLQVREADGSITVQVLRSGDLSKRATVEVVTVPSGSRRAQPGVDYTPVDQRVVFEAGVDRRQIQIPILDNGTYDGSGGPRTLSLVIRYPEAAAITNDEVQIAIVDDEPPPQPTPSPTPTATPAPGGGGGGAMGLWLLITGAGGVALRRRWAVRHRGIGRS